MTKRYWPALAMLLVALDAGLTYWQNYQLPLDGDLVPTIYPAPWYSRVLHDPFGWAVLARNEVYAGPNRFFAHATLSWYWKHVPLWLQHVTTPINSLYAASALFTTAAQLLILFVLAAYVRLGSGGSARRGGASYWLAVALLAPLFQTDGFYEQMGITNRAITYTFFYTLPTGLVLVLLWPFYQAACQHQPLRLAWWRAGLLGLLMVVISFNGPIGTAAVAVLLLGIGLYWVGRQRRAAVRWPAPGSTLATGWLSGQALGLLALLAALSLYSLYIGRNNSENSHTYSLGELYQRLPVGLYNELTMQWGLPLLGLLVLVNAQLIRRLLPASAERQRVLTSLRWVGWFALVFVLLLPLGGYRDYRSYLIRNDSIQPVLIGLFYAYGISTGLLLQQLRARPWGGYAAGVALFAGLFSYVDATIQMPRNNDCERWALDQLARAPEPVVRIAPYCPLLSWAPMADYHGSEMQADLLYRWRITNGKKRYYQ